MSILTGPAIVAAVRDGRISIDPFDEALVNPASVDLRLGHLVRTYVMEVESVRVRDDLTVTQRTTRDLKQPWASECREIPEDGLVLREAEERARESRLVHHDVDDDRVRCGLHMAGGLLRNVHLDRVTCPECRSLAGSKS